MGADMKNKKHCLLRSNQKGFASIETVFLLVLFFSMLSFCFGFFGIVHTGIVYNIHSRTYLFETFRHRANLMYFRTNIDEENTYEKALHYYNHESRLHGIDTDVKKFDDQQTATERPLAIFINPKDKAEELNRSATYHHNISNKVGSQRRTSEGVNPVWITTQYGICLKDIDCGTKQ